MVVGSCSLLVGGNLVSVRRRRTRENKQPHRGGEGEGKGGRELICIRSTTPGSRYLSASVHAFETEKGEVGGLLVFS